MADDGPTITLGQLYVMTGEGVTITADTSAWAGSGNCFELDGSDGGAGGSWIKTPLLIGDATTGGGCPVFQVFEYTAPPTAGLVTITFQHEDNAPITYANGQTLTVYSGTYPCGVSYAASVAVNGQIVITLHVEDDSGGATWDVTFSDGGAGGSFNPPGATISDATGGGPTTAQTIYTAPSSPQTVTFNFQSSVSGGGNILLFEYTPPTLAVVAAGNKHAAFLSFFE